MIMKKISILLWPFLLILLWIGVPAAVHASSPLTVVVNGNVMKSDVPPQVINDRTVVPIYFVGDAYGVKVSWDKTTGTAIVDDGKGNIIKLKNNQNNAYVNDKAVWLDQAPVIINDRMFLPFRNIGEFLGATVGWEGSSNTVIVNKPKKITVNGSDVIGVNVYQLPSGHFVDIGPVAKVLGYDVQTSGGKVILEQGTEKYTLNPSSGYGTDGYRTIDGHSVISPEFLSQLIDGKINWNEDQTVCTLDKLQHIKGITRTSAGIAIQTDGQMTPSTFTLDNPDRIVMDFNHAKLDFDTSDVNSALMKDIRVSQTSESPYRVRIVIDLWSPAIYSVTTNTGETDVALKESDSPVPATNPDSNQDPSAAPTPAPTTGSGKYTIVVDPGHGGKDTGAVGIAGNYEKDLTLAVALKLQADLAKNPNFNVIMTREADTYPTLQDRVDIANNDHADLFLSIHANSAVPSAHGTESYYTRSDSQEYASIMYNHLINATGFTDRGLRTANFYVIKYTKMPATLVELGFVTNSAENKEMLTSDFQQRTADALAAGITEYYNKHH
ncbi:N-acetylmuramoyl-L-alanine amidase family protein [Aneurinibacillus terranovensis]|uniref:N-acetylmuramoyl-L-alanine amidase family protein n=1 Tax=Aneurinibacillus terranovensis TaxID=278991 RepID=UPI00040E9A54|nr:N-acetylmuramoyl-L-alanine amidase family protein [Aneurinibacillus terranovensis]